METIPLLRPSPAPLIRFNHKISFKKHFQNIKSIYQLQFKHVLDLLVNPAHPGFLTPTNNHRYREIGGGAALALIVRRESKQTAFKAISELKRSDLFTEL